MSNSLWLHVRLQIHNSRLLFPWNSPGKNTGVGCHLLLQGIFPTQGSPPLQADSTIWATREASKILNTQLKIPCATTKTWCSQINTYSLKKESFFQFLNSLLISYIYVSMCFYRNVVEFGKTSTNSLSYAGCKVSGHFKLCCAVNNIKYSSNWPYLY